MRAKVKKLHLNKFTILKSTMAETGIFYLICYDIVKTRRRNRVARLLEGYGLRVQKSVFECVLTPDQRLMLLKRLEKCIKPQEDQVRFYPLSPRYRQKVLILGTQPQQQVDDAAVIV